MELLTVAVTVMGVILPSSIFLQARIIWKNKSSRNISIPLYIISSLGATLWIIYGAALNNAPIIISNVIGLVAVLSVLALSFKFRRRK